jgi:glycosyltransferase involved in cell wall biosynthesis
VKILQLHNRHASRGGADDVMDEEREILTRAGHEVEQYVQRATADIADKPVQQAISAVWNRAVTADLDERIDRFRPDVVHVHTPFPLMSPAVFRTAHRRRCATVATCHSYRYSCIKGTLLRDGGICEDCVGSRLKISGVRHHCYHESTAASLAMTTSLVLHHRIHTFTAHVDRFIALTSFARELLIRDGIPADNVVVKPNMVPDPGPQLSVTPRSGYVAFIGRLVEEKGIRTLLEAWRFVSPGSRLLIAGDGPLRPLVEAAAAEGRGVEYLGWLTNDGVSDLLSHASLLAFCSEWYEGAPLTLLRSLAAGTPVICSGLENISAGIVPHGAGVSFRTGNPASLAEAVSSALADRSWLVDAGRRARQTYLAHHTPEATLEALERIYVEARGRVDSP